MIDINQLQTDYSVRISLTETDEYIIVDSFFVYSSSRNQGVGTEVMNKIISVGKPVYLTPSNELGGNKRGLKRFYERLGFVRNRDRTIKQELVRK